VETKKGLLSSLLSKYETFQYMTYNDPDLNKCTNSYVHYFNYSPCLSVLSVHELIGYRCNLKRSQTNNLLRRCEIVILLT